MQYDVANAIHSSHSTVFGIHRSLKKKMRILVTGGAGFIGSSLIRYIIHQTQDSVLNIDKLTYASNLAALEMVETNPRYAFQRLDICDAESLAHAFAEYQPEAVIHLAAETHVDRSIDNSAAFIQSNIIGTYTLLEVARQYYQGLPIERQSGFRFLHVSTDEVYGDLGFDQDPCTEMKAYHPSSPYSASKASSDHLVRAWYRTYGLPVIVTNCSNNYGPYQHPEKLIPLMIQNALNGKALPIYGDGLQVRDWLFVEDHVRALYAVVTQGKVGESYNIGANNERTNRELVEMICAILDELYPVQENPNTQSLVHYADLIQFVKDRPGHDRRYAIDSSKIKKTLAWKAQESVERGVRKTVQWFLDNQT